jgi:hypothetical protein
MADVFVSIPATTRHASRRSWPRSRRRAGRCGGTVVAAGQQFDDQIEAELQAASAVLVVWTPTSVSSRWVHGEARDAAERDILVPVRFDNARLPIGTGDSNDRPRRLGRGPCQRTVPGSASFARHRDRAPACVTISEVGRYRRHRRAAAALASGSASCPSPT